MPYRELLPHSNLIVQKPVSPARWHSGSGSGAASFPSCLATSPVRKPDNSARRLNRADFRLAVNGYQSATLLSTGLSDFEAEPFSQIGVESSQRYRQGHKGRSSDHPCEF